MRDEDGGEPVLMVIEKSSHCLSFYDTQAQPAPSSTASRSLDIPTNSPSIRAKTRLCRTLRRQELHSSGPRRRVRSDRYRPTQIVARDRLQPLPSSAWRQARRRGSAACSQRRRQCHAAVRGTGHRHRAFVRALPTGGLKSHLFALSRGGEWAYCMSLMSHTVSEDFSRWREDRRVSTLSPGERPEGHLLSADEKTLFVGTRGTSTLVAIDTETMTVVRRAAARRDPSRIYGLDDGKPARRQLSGHEPVDDRPALA